MKSSFVLCFFLLLFQGNCLTNEVNDTSENFETTTTEYLLNDFTDDKNLELIEGTTISPNSADVSSKETVEKLPEDSNNNKLPQDPKAGGLIGDADAIKEIIPENEIPNNKLLNRIGFADDPSSDQNSNKETPRGSHDTWKPVWPYGTPSSGLKTNSPTLLQSEFVTNTRTLVHTVPKEPVTAYYFDVSHTALPPVGPLHDPSLLKSENDSKTVSLVTNVPFTTSTIEKGPEYSVHPSNTINRVPTTREPFISEPEVKAHVRSEYNNNLTFATVLPPADNVKSENENKFVTLKPKKVSSKTTEIPNPTIESSMSDTTTGNTQNIESSFGPSMSAMTTGNTQNIKLSFAPSPTNSFMQNATIGQPYTRTPLWVRLSSKSSVSPSLSSTQTHSSTPSVTFSKNALASTTPTLEVSTPLIQPSLTNTTTNTALFSERLPSSTAFVTNDLSNTIELSTKPTVTDKFVPSNVSILVPVPELASPSTEAIFEEEVTTVSMNTSETSTSPISINGLDERVTLLKETTSTISNFYTNISTTTEKSVMESLSNIPFEENDTSGSLNNNITLKADSEIKTTVEVPKQMEITTETMKSTEEPVPTEEAEVAATMPTSSITAASPSIEEELEETTPLSESESGAELKKPEMKMSFNKSSPYVKADLSYNLQEFCSHQDHIRSLLGEWINNHLKNKTHLPKYTVEFFGTPNCSEMENKEANSENTTILYFYVVGDGKIRPNVTAQYPRNPTKLEISEKLAYLKEKVLNLELVNAISSSNDLVLEEAAVGTSILVIVLSSIVLIFIVISSVLAFIIVKKRRASEQTHGRRCTPADTYSMDSISVFYQSLRRKSKKRQSNKSLKSYLNQGFDDPNSPSRPLNFAKLTHFISDIEGIYNEFMKIPSVNPKYDEMPRGIEDKNRYANVIPVPETRVLLNNNVSNPYEEYINANYVHGARGESKYFIATQAPMDNTVANFWQMIWEEESKVIVMLTDFVEKGIDKCADYLPPSETLDCHRVYGEFQVTLKSRDLKEKYVVSQVQLKNLENNLVREISHMWYTGWPYTGIPNEEKSFISFIFETRAMRKKLRAKGPIVVHCSPGTGRTGTFIGCDISMRNFDDQKSVDIPKTVWRIRRERAGAVQTKEQYAYIYRVTNLYAAKLMTGNLDLF